jgi:hypothetical protein
MIDPHGKNSVKEMLAGCIAVALYLAVCQFLVARNCALGVRTEVAVPEGTNVDAIAHRQYKPSKISVLFPAWPILVAMVAPLLAISFLMMATEKRDVFTSPGTALLGNSGFVVGRRPPSRAACDNFGDARP